MGTIYLHIGTHKTGSSAIQAFCLANIAALERRSISFPQWPDQIDPSHNAVFFARSMQEAKLCGCSPAQTECWRSHMADVEALLLKYTAVLMVNEELWELSCDDLALLLTELKCEGDARGFGVKIIVYLRRQDQYFSSLWSQHIKTCLRECSVYDWQTYIAQVIEERRYDYFTYLEHISQAVGRENLILRVYERGRFLNGDVVDDCFSLLGLKLDDEFVRTRQDVNQSLSLNMTEIRRIINALPGYAQQRPWLMDKAARDCSALPEEAEKWTVFTREELDSFLALCEPSNHRIAQEYFGSAEPLFSPPGPLPPQWTPDNPDMYASIVRYFGAVVFAQQQEIEKLRQDLTSHFYFRRKFRGLFKSIPRRLKQLFGRQA